MENMEASFVFDVKVGTFDQLEQSKICIMSVIKLGLVMLMVQCDLIFSLCFMFNPQDLLRQPSPAVRSIVEYPVDITKTSDFRYHSRLVIPVHKHTSSDEHTANRGTIGNPCNLWLYPAGFILSGSCMLPVTHSILT